MISSTDRYIYYVGKTVGGTTHDYQAFKQEFDQHLGLLDTYQVLADLGYLGLPVNYGPGSIELPHRKPRRSKAHPDTCLTDEQKQVNSQHARIRVKVEHSIGGSKRLGVVSQVFRNKSLVFNDLALALAAGIWNFHLKAH
jgi:hypothetical protein